MADPRAVMTLKVDLLNEQPFLELAQNAIDLCACAEVALEYPESSAARARLKEAAERFRSWFKDGEDA